MHDRSHDLSLAGVVIGAVGTFSQQLVLSVLGFVLTLVMHFLNGRQNRGELPKVRAELEYWKSRAHVLDQRLDEVSSEWKELKRRYEPAVIVPPFLPAEASTNCIEREA